MKIPEVCEYCGGELDYGKLRARKERHFNELACQIEDAAWEKQNCAYKTA